MANVLNDLKNYDIIVVVLIIDIDTKVNEKLTLLTKVYKAVCQSMGEENINKLVRRSNHTLLCHCHTMTADKISLLYFFAILDELRTITLTQESLKGDMSEMIKFTYELKCFKDALEIRVNIFYTPFCLQKNTAFLNHQKSGENLQEFYPDKKPLEAKAKKDYGETL